MKQGGGSWEIFANQLTPLLWHGCGDVMVKTMMLICVCVHVPASVYICRFVSIGEARGFVGNL